MKSIVEILGTEKKKGFTITHALLSDGTEASGVGEFKVGDHVMYWFEEKYNKIKMKRKA